jgi:hypothetical protein
MRREDFEKLSDLQKLFAHATVGPSAAVAAAVS